MALGSKAQALLRVCYKWDFFSNSISRAGDHFSRQGAKQPASQEASSSRLGQVQGQAGAWGGKGALSPDHGGLHICLSLKPRWIEFLDVYLPQKSSVLGPRRAQLRTWP